MIAHTTGPWQWTENCYALRPANPDPAHSAVHTILEAHGGSGFIASKPTETAAELAADFALIEAAPKLLAALTRLHSVCLGMDLERQGDRPSEDDYQGAMWDAEAAIAHATQVQP